MTKEGKPVSFGWVLAFVLLVLYFFFKIQGWWYAFQVSRLSDQIVEMRPAISAIIRSEQVRATSAAYAEAFEQVRQSSLDPEPFLMELSSETPPSVTLTGVDVHEESGFTLEGMVLAGTRSPEEALMPWARRLQQNGADVRIRKLFPDSQLPGIWRFEIRSQKGED